MFILPNGVDINNLIENLKVFSWESADILKHYSENLKDLNFKNGLLETLDNNDPVTEENQLSEDIAEISSSEELSVEDDITKEE